MHRLHFLLRMSDVVVQQKMSGKIAVKVAKVIMSRGGEELLIGREAARIALILYQIQCEQNFQLAARKANHTLKH